jgi:putrescine---pyruvate transaminase
MTSSISRIWSPFCDLSVDRTDTVTIIRGEGAYVEDAVGNRYLDGTAGLWYTLIGHGRREMAAAIAEQVETLAAFKTHGEYDNLPARALADELATSFPVEDPLAFFTSGGGDAIDTACKMARSYWDVRGASGKKLILSRQHAYHGMNGFGTRIAGIDPLRLGSEDGYPADVVPTNDVDALRRRIETIGSERIAAFVAEPVIGAGGIIPPAPDYLEAAQRLCRDNDILFVCDEVVTGFGRLGSWSGAEHFGLAPDICVLAKGITSGYVPLGAVLASRTVWGAFEETGTVFRHGYTYSGHPTACAAALKNLEILRQEHLVEHTAALAGPFAAELGRLVDDQPLITEVRAIGLMAGIDLDHDLPPASIGDAGTAMVERCRAHGLIVRRTFEGGLQISPPLVIGTDEVRFIAEAVGRAASELTDRAA